MKCFLSAERRYAVEFKGCEFAERVVSVAVITNAMNSRGKKIPPGGSPLGFMKSL